MVTEEEGDEEANSSSSSSSGDRQGDIQNRAGGDIYTTGIDRMENRKGNSRAAIGGSG
jgi:hypothetical protein